MAVRYATALSHLILLGNGLYCHLKCELEDLIYSHALFGILIINSALGVFKWGNPSYGYKATSLYRLTSVVQACIILPCLTTLLLLKYEVLLQVHYGNLVMSCLPLTLYLLHRNHRDMLDIVIGLNSLLLGTVCYWNENYYGVAAAVSYVFSHFVIGNDGDFLNILPCIDLYNYALCFFSIFALKSTLLN